jgi:hypothetical protein
MAKIKHVSRLLDLESEWFYTPGTAKKDGTCPPFAAVSFPVVSLRSSAFSFATRSA